MIDQEDWGAAFDFLLFSNERRLFIPDLVLLLSFDG